MNHQQKVNEIINILSDTTYTWIEIYRGERKIFHLTDGSRAICGTKIPDASEQCVSRSVSVNAVDTCHSDPDFNVNDCKRCAAMIKKDYTRYGFNEP